MLKIKHRNGHFVYICLMRKCLILLLALLGFSAFATHNRSGYISYCYNPSTGKYTFRIFTYTNLSSTPADRCEQTLFIDNQDSIICPRVNGTGPGPNNCPVDGVEIVPASGSYGGVKENIYEGSLHLNPGMHVLTMIDPNRDAGIINLGGSGSQNITFALVDTIYIWNMVGLRSNCTPTVSNPPIQNACADQNWCYNPGMVDPENDSLVYSLSKSYEDDPNNPPGGVQPIFGETFPSVITVDPLTGDLCWKPVPHQQGEYNLALLIKEYRKNPIDGKRYPIGTMIFDIQVLVVECTTSNQITFMQAPANTCIVADGVNSYSAAASASGTGITPPLNLSASGLPFNASVVGTPSHFSASSSGNSASGTFSWTPTCKAVHSNPYYVTIEAKDSNTPLANANFSTFNILVISPPPSNVVATPQGSNIHLSWSAPPGCGQTTGNVIQKYLIYRNDSCNPFVPAPCQTGVPASSGYALVGTTTASTFTFTDSNFGLGLAPGNSYSYIIVAQFADGSLSIASSSTANTCVTLKLDVPLMMKVSVDTTDASAGKMIVWWKNPFIDPATGLDTTSNPGPYKYVLQRKTPTGTYAPVYTVTETYFHWLKQVQDTTYTDVNFDTQSSQYVYKVDFYSNSNFIGSASSASSVFLSAAPHDKRVVLSWNVQVPWVNILYYVLRQRNGGLTDGYDTVGTTTNTTFTDSGLTNKHTYCYKILAKGLYPDNRVNPQPPLSKYTMNFSQKLCVAPFDDSAPCQPALSIWGDGTCSSNTLAWTNPNHSCGIDDVVKYYIYFSDFKDSALVKIDSILNPNDTSYYAGPSTSIAGCYVIVAVDSVGNQSPVANEVCTDNCPVYELPNIFTPNNDNVNDQYVPVKNRYIKSVEFTMYNRWGEIVFETTDPALKWDGKSKQMKVPVSDGTYYYICKVNEIHYYGIRSHTLKGFVQILH